jgi:hypothetical protein
VIGLIFKMMAALASFLIAMMAAADAQKARERGRPLAFFVFLLFASGFGMAAAWVVLNL